MSLKEVELARVLNQALQTLGVPSMEGVDVVAESKSWFAEVTLTTVQPTLFNENHLLHALGRVCTKMVSVSSPSTVITTAETVDEARLCWQFIGSLKLGLPQGDARDSVQRIILQECIELHYGIIKPPMFDIFAHLSANEMFFIDGDSLIMEALCKPLVDWDLMQPLHVNFFTQRILQELLARGGKFHVIFFDSSRWIWNSAPQKLFIREQIKDSLLNLSSKAQSKFIVRNFPSWYSVEYKSHFEKFDPEFVMMTDGEQMNEQTVLQLGYTLNSAASFRSVVEDETIGARAAVYYHCFMINCIASHAQVVYSSRLIFKDNAVVAFVVRASSDRFAQYLAIQDRSVELARSLVQEIALPKLKIASAKEQALKGDLFVSYRERVAAAAILSYLDAEDRTEEDVALCKALWVSVIAMGVLPAAARAQPVSPAPQLKDFLNAMAPFLLAATKHVGVETGRGQEFDAIDGHLLFAFARLLPTAPVKDLLSEDYSGAIQDVWNQFIGDEDNIIDETITGLPSLVKPEKPSVKIIPPVQHELVTVLAKTFQVTLPNVIEPYPSGLGASAGLAGWDGQQPFDELNDVLNAGKVEDDKEKDKTDPKVAERRLRVATRYAQVTQEIAESLGAALFLGSGETLTQVVDRKEDGAPAPKEKQKHTGQKTTYTRTTADKIREENNLRRIRQNNSKQLRTLSDLLSKSERFNDETRQTDRDNAMFSLQQNMDSYRIEESLISDGEVSMDASYSKVAVWRALVNLAKKSERDVALDSGLECFEIAKQLVEQEHKKLVANLKQTDASKSTHVPLLFRGALMDGDKERHESRDVATRFVQQMCLFFVENHYMASLELRIMRIAFHEWQQEREAARTNSRKPDMKKAVKLFIRIHKVITRIEISGIRLPTEDVMLIRSAVRYLEFPDTYNKKVDEMIGTFQGLPLGSLPENLKPKHTLMNHTVERFQMCEMGELLERPIPPFRDSRVSFKPDSWQKELLDVVDRRGSAVVCAPTSAGKTFISFYCMKAALMTSNDRIVVYVAPTRALINQAVADVCARFGTKKYQNPGLHVYGALGGDDFHIDHDTCQVLITLPEVFEIMLMSPKYVEWAKRIDYVIFDEIHSMESSGNGPVWERILSLTTAPFIALSATLGETTQLCAWLNRIQQYLQVDQAGQSSSKSRDYNVCVIPKAGEKIQRWNDIEKYVFQPPSIYIPSVERTDRNFEYEHIKHLHPLSTVTLTTLRGKFPPDLSLVPKESLSLYDVMRKHLTPLIESYSDVDAFKDMLRVLDNLTPEVFFDKDRHIVQTRARQYEAVIKDELLRWAQLGVNNLEFTMEPLSDSEILEFREDMTEVVTKVLETFQQHLKDGEDELKTFSLEKKDIETAPFPNSIAFVKRHIFNVLRELKARDRRPTIVFSFEPEDCELLVEHVVTVLEEAEAEYRQTTEFDQYCRAMNAKKEAAEVRRRLRESSANQERATARGDEDGRAQDTERYTEDVAQDDNEDYEIPEVLPQFAFFGRGEFNPTQFTKILEDCESRGADLFSRAIKRGICIHHNGISGKLRGHAERMFRSLYCSVIFATETLALGVHSPCRSVVLAGDHILLNTTQFRQMMGRAGRRGLDNLGHLIFMGVSLKKVNRLMTSDLMVIKGHVQVDAVTQLRLLQLHDFEKQRNIVKKDLLKWKEGIRNVATRIFANPLYFLGRNRIAGGNMESFQVRLLQALLRYFHGEGLHFSESEGTSSLGALITTVTHIFRNAGSHNSGFLFAHLLTSGALSGVKYVNNIVDMNPDTVLEAAIESLAYCFSVNATFNIPLELHRSAFRDPEVETLWTFQGRKFTRTHRVALTSLRGLNLSRVESRRKAMMMLLSSFYHQEAQFLQSAHDNRLPFMTYTYKDKSRTTLAKFPIFAGEDCEPEQIVDKLLTTASEFRARHPIAALSGCGDDFASLEELSLTLRDDGLFADIGMFPFVDFTDNSRHEMSQIIVNACAADFIRVGAQMKGGEYRRALLQSLNGLSQQDSYHALDRMEKIMSNLVMEKPNPKSNILETVRSIRPENTASASCVSANLTIAAGEKLCDLRRQIDNEAYKDLQEQGWKRTVDQQQATREMVKRGLGK